MSNQPLLEQLMEALRCLPGVGPKSAQRMAFHLLERNRDGGRRLAGIMAEAMEKIGHCQRCQTLSEEAICNLCSNPNRNDAQLCVVETPADVVILERVTDYRGRYFVLGGHLSPLDGIGPKELGLDRLEKLLAEGDVKEMILAVNPTVEGEVTSHYISEMGKERTIQVTRIAQGVPLGGELEYVDGGTLSHAFADRREV